MTHQYRGSDPMWEPAPRPHGSNYTGENLVWSLQLDIQRGALSGNTTLVAKAFARMWGSIVLACQPGDGLMADGSFHQHGPLLQSGAYGSAFMLDILAFVQLSAGTGFAIPDTPLGVFVHYLVEGQANMIRVGAGVAYPAWMIPPRGREISRPGNGNASDAGDIADGIVRHFPAQFPPF